jgi:hypothetical protein
VGFHDAFLGRQALAAGKSTKPYSSDMLALGVHLFRHAACVFVLTTRFREYKTTHNPIKQKLFPPNSTIGPQPP